jgi:hypothetical protein
MITPFVSTAHGDLGAKFAIYGQQSVNDDRNFRGQVAEALEKLMYPEQSQG